MLHSEERTLILKVVEEYVRTGKVSDERIKISVLPPGKTTYVEQIGQDSRSVMLDEYRIDGRVVWAGYSSRSGTVYLSIPRG